MGEKLPHMVQTNCTQLCQSKRPAFQAVVFANDGARMPSILKHRKSESLNRTVEDERPEFEMKRVRYEVMKFSNSNLLRQEREQAEIELAVRLGANPPKRMYLNYKELLEKKKAAKEEDKAYTEMMLKKKINNKKVKGKKVTKKGILESYGKLTSRKDSKKLIKGKRKIKI